MDKKFEHYLHKTRGEFAKAVNELQWNTGFRTKCENLLIAFDQMNQALRQPPVIGSVCTCMAFHKSDECYKLGCKAHRSDEVQTVL